jgi:hypothetical protein
VSNLLFFRRSLALRMRKARAMTPGPERLATRRLARALGDLAKTEAWLEGQTPRLRPVAQRQEIPRRAVSWSAPPARVPGTGITFQRALNRSAYGWTDT